MVGEPLGILCKGLLPWALQQWVASPGSTCVLNSVDPLARGTTWNQPETPEGFYVLTSSYKGLTYNHSSKSS